MAKLYIGTSGFQYTKWKGDFYPEKLSTPKMLGYYIQHFSSVEINGTFYRTPKESTVRKWLDAVPEDFVYVFKGSRFVSHFSKLDPEAESLTIFFKPFEGNIDPKRKHVVLWQMAASFPANPEKLESFLKVLPDYFRYAFEFRHETWFIPEIYKILKKNNAALVLADSPKRGKGRLWPLEDEDTADFYYIRFHGSKALYTTQYTDEELQHYARLLSGKMKRGMDVYAYFNNDAQGHAPHDAKRLREMILNLN